MGGHTGHTAVTLTGVGETPRCRCVGAVADAPSVALVFPSGPETTVAAPVAQGGVIDTAHISRHEDLDDDPLGLGRHLG